MLPSLYPRGKGPPPFTYRIGWLVPQVEKRFLAPSSPQTKSDPSSVQPSRYADYTMQCFLEVIQNTVEPGYNDIGLCDTSSIASDILWYQLIRHC
jgi:hypothetical protein